MSYIWKRAAGYNGDEGADYLGLGQDYIDYGENEEVEDFAGPKDWIVTYPSDDPESGKVIGFRCLGDNIPRNALVEKSAAALKSGRSDLCSPERSERVEDRIQQVLGQCDYIASMKGLAVSEIRQKLHENEQQYLENQRARNCDTGPVYYFVNPPPLKSPKQTDTKENTAYRRDSPHEITNEFDELYDDNIVSEDEYSQDFVPTDVPNIHDYLKGSTRGISSPTDYEEDEAEFKNFFSMVQKIHDKCEKVKAEDKNYKSSRPSTSLT